jgi:chlorite dismutase
MIEVVDFGEVQRQRKEAAEQTMKAVTAVQVAATLQKIFLNNSSHPWAQRSADFVEQHKTDTILSAELPDGYHVIFYPKVEKGLWYKLGARLEGVGMLQPPALEKLCGIARKKGLV